MKTTKKGFTLIELIVVIAIIGVLAAILVPTMLGYVRKSKISSANSAASSVYKAINSALTELDEEGEDIGGSATITLGDKTGEWSDVSSICSGADDKMTKKIKNFFSDVTKLTGGKAAITGASCIACAVATDSTYCGTYPGGVVTSDTFTTYNQGKDSVDAALEAAIAKADYVDDNNSGWKKSGTT